MLHFARWKINLILAVCGLGILFAAPNLLTEEQAVALPGWLPHKQISLGLDLQGGAHLLLEVDADSVVRERLESLEDEVRVTLRGVKIGYTALGVLGEAVTVTLKDPDIDREQEHQIHHGDEYRKRQVSVEHYRIQSVGEGATRRLGPQAVCQQGIDLAISFIGA